MLLPALLRGVGSLFLGLNQHSPAGDTLWVQSWGSALSSPGPGCLCVLGMAFLCHAAPCPAVLGRACTGLSVTFLLTKNLLSPPNLFSTLWSHSGDSTWWHNPGVPCLLMALQAKGQEGCKDVFCLQNSSGSK